MSATRCTCILDGRLEQLVVDPTCPATRVHLAHRADDAASRPAR